MKVENTLAVLALLAAPTTSAATAEKDSGGKDLNEFYVNKAAGKWFWAYEPTDAVAQADVDLIARWPNGDECRIKVILDEEPEDSFVLTATAVVGTTAKCPYVEEGTLPAIDMNTDELTGPKGEKWEYVEDEEDFKEKYPSYFEEFQKLASVNIQTGIVALASLATFLAM